MDDELIDSARAGNLEEVERLLDRGADVNAQVTFFGNALQTAAVYYKLEVAKLLIERGANVNAQGGDYGNALQAAALRGSLDVVKLLIEQGADVNAQGGWYDNALQAAARFGGLEVVKLLIEQGADVNAQGGCYGNALQAAARGGALEVVKLLIEQGADVNVQGGQYGNALQAAAKEGSLEVVKFLIERGANVNAQGGEYGNALQAAASSGDLQIVKHLVDKGANIQAKGGAFGNALQAAASSGSFQVVELLVNEDADIFAKGGQFGNALIAAVWKGNFDAAEYLIGRGVDIDFRDHANQTALHRAVRKHSRKAVEWLLSKGASPDAEDVVGTAPFDLAVNSANGELIELMLPKIKPIRNKTAQFWRKSRSWKPESDLVFTFDEFLSFRRLDWDLPEELCQLLPPDSYLSSYHGAFLNRLIHQPQIYVVFSGRHFHQPSGVMCRWWRKAGDASAWEIQPTLIPNPDLCHVKPGDIFVQCGYVVRCLRATDVNWQSLRTKLLNENSFKDLQEIEGFSWFATSQKIDGLSADMHSNEDVMRPIVCLTTCEDICVQPSWNNADLVGPLIRKLQRTLENNRAVTSRQLFSLRAEVLRVGGGDSKLLETLLSDARLIEYMVQDHTDVVQSLTNLIDSLENMSSEPWKLSEESSKKLRGEVNQLDRLGEAFRALLERSQNIIELEFNLTSILEAQRSTTSNRSIKRLTWVTFVFLPLLFVTSLFGMNVDVLKNNPSWLWYFPFAGGTIFFTFAVWVIFKRFHTLEGRLESRFSWLIGSEDQRPSDLVRSSSDLEQGPSDLVRGFPDLVRGFLHFVRGFLDHVQGSPDLEGSSSDLEGSSSDLELNILSLRS